MLAVLIVPIVRYYCFKKGYVDIPNDRKVHKIPIPRLGGVAIWLCTLLTFAILVAINKNYPYGNGLSGILIGGSIMFLLGMIDDLYNLSPKFKLFVQIGAALIACLLGVKIELLSAFGPNGLHLGLLSIPLTIFWLVGISNAMNFIDGVDGLAGGITAISAVTLGVVAIYTHQPISALVAAILAGSMMGFLLFNFNPAKIFMGDSGALFAGFTLAALAVTGVLKTVAVTIFLPLLILAVPILDISFSILRRLSKGANPFIADSEHIHHKLLKAGFSQNKTVLSLYIFCIAAGTIATAHVHGLKLYFGLVIPILLIMLILSFLSKNKKLNEIHNKIVNKSQDTQNAE